MSDTPLSPWINLQDTWQTAIWLRTGELINVDWPPNVVPLKGFGMAHFTLIAMAGVSLPPR